MSNLCHVCCEPIPIDRGSSTYCSQHCIDFEIILQDSLASINQFGSLALPPEVSEATSFYKPFKLFEWFLFGYLNQLGKKK